MLVVDDHKICTAKFIYTLYVNYTTFDLYHIFIYVYRSSKFCISDDGIIRVWVHEIYNTVVGNVYEF